MKAQQLVRVEFVLEQEPGKANQITGSECHHYRTYLECRPQWLWCSHNPPRDAVVGVFNIFSVPINELSQNFFPAQLKISRIILQ